MTLSTLLRSASRTSGVLAVFAGLSTAAIPPQASAAIFGGPPAVQNDFLTPPPGGTSGPASVAVGDFNGDGHPDIAVVNNDSGILMIFTSNSIGTLTPQHEYGIFNLVKPDWVTAADVNGDGKLDLIVSDATGVSILLGQGDLTAAFVAASPQRPAFPASIFVGAARSVVRDVNNDGRPDIVVMRVDAGTGIEADETHLTVLLGQGGGHFGPPDDYDLDGSNSDTSSLALANFDADLQPDVLFADGNKVYFMKGNGDGTFQSPVQVIALGAAVGVVSAQAVDLDGDGNVDYLMSQGKDVLWAKGNGNGTLQAPQQIFSNPAILYFGPVTLPVVGDFNHDGLPDFAVAGLVYLQLPNHAFAFSEGIGWGDTAILAGLDLNGDLRTDLITVGPGPNQIASFLTTAGAATHVLITGGDHQSTTFSTAFATPLSVKVLDANNVGVPNVQVSFAGFPNGLLAAGATTTPGIVFTNALGNATDTATANNTLGCYPVNILVQGIPGIPAFFDFCNTGSDVLTVTTGDNQGTLINTAFPTALEVKLTDSGNNPKPGVTITFKAPAANASAALSIPATTDVNGLASVNATANGIAGPYAILVSAPSGAQASFHLSNSAPASAAAQIIVAGLSSPQSGLINTSTFFPLSVQVVDSNLNPVVGAVVAYTAQADPQTGASSSLDFATATTDGSGNAQVLATANGLVGSYTVKVTLQGNPVVQQQVISLRNYARLPKAIALVSGSPQSTSLNTVFTQKLRVRLTDDLGNAAPQVLVYFAPPANGAGATLSASSVLTDANGFAEVTATGNGTPGSYSVTATVFATTIEAPITVSFDLTNGGVVAAVPTLSEWGLALLALLLGGLSLRLLKRRVREG
jgi:hypothetical protein